MSARRAPAAPPPLPGYRFVSVLGSGGFSDVYLYEQDRPRRKVAVKVLTADLKTEGARASFESEANLMAQLSAHPYIVTIFEAEITDSGHSYLAMEYCSRPSLDMQYRQGRFSADKALEIGIQVASAVETAHRAGIAHRDIKPANVLVTDYNRPALTDFGISGTVDSAQNDGGGMSIPWSPPESFAAGATDGVKVDIWALGATIYTLLAGHSPFVIPGADNSQRQLTDRIGSAALPRLGRADVPEALELVLATAMAKSPNSRYRTAKDFARALMRVQADLNLSVTPFEVQEEVVAHAPRTGDTSTEDTSEATRVRSIVSIDPEAGNSNASFPTHSGTGKTSSGQPSPRKPGTGAPAAGSANTGTGNGGAPFSGPPQVNTVPGVAGSTTSLTRNGQTVPSASPGTPNPAAGNGPGSSANGFTENDSTGNGSTDTAGGPTVGKSHSQVASPTEWNDSAARRPETRSHDFVLDSTVQRGELLQPVPAGRESAGPDQGAPAGKKRLWLGLGSGLVLAAAVVVGLVVFINVGAPDKAETVAEQTATPPPALVIGAEVPPVTELTAAPKNGGSEWSWTNPDPEAGDKYLWASVSAVDSGVPKPTTDTRVFVVNGPNEQSCISVKLVRKNGQTSPELKKCS
ncbi:serine/threonine protein kinase [Arthrobacter sp. H35-D1]|uniref:serine/threonine protein kinase n=1 Tax=Arthrobacter sp. H35-D1 TaxID=3046202 RepID=UPI0024BA59AA|nr:serine/threonine protein kinase [Arthrobacter sp. H35-D1]MDJ0314383.1 protein kinase [Arthrobacter sp. H35-D1]